MNYVINIGTDGKAAVEGLDQPKCEVWHRPHERVIVLRVPARKFFAGQGRPWMYDGPRFQVFSIVDGGYQDEGKCLVTWLVADFAATRGGRR